jgi:hypothetical protein
MWFSAEISLTDPRKMKQANDIARLLSITLAICLLLVSINGSSAQDKPDPGITLAEGKVVLKTPKEWVRKKPSNRIVEHEFETPPVEGDKLPGRITAMGAGGTVQANIDRWIGQFAQPDGKSTKDKTTVQKLKVNGQEVHYVDIPGIYKDSPGGPFSGTPAVMRENYRMLGAIIVTEKSGNYFVKYYGPKATVTANEKLFKEMVDSLQVK